MKREEAMREAALDAFNAGAVAVSRIATTAGADAERARVVAWLREDAEALEGTQTNLDRLIAEAIRECADAVDRGEHWGG